MAWSDKARQAAAEARKRHATHPTGGTPNAPRFTNEYGQSFVKPYGQHTGTGRYRPPNQVLFKSTAEANSYRKFRGLKPK